MSRAPKISPSVGRSVAEWIGKNADDRPPPHVRLRIFRRFDGVCHISKQKIVPGDKWELEHIKPLHQGGENRESNMAPALKASHAVKTAEEAAGRAKSDAVAKKHFGIKSESRPGPRSLKAAPKDRTYKDPFAGLPRRCCGVVIED